jgi:hypothetical protein
MRRFIGPIAVYVMKRCRAIGSEVRAVRLPIITLSRTRGSNHNKTTRMRPRRRDVGPIRSIRVSRNQKRRLLAKSQVKNEPREVNCSGQKRNVSPLSAQDVCVFFFSQSPPKERAPKIPLFKRVQPLIRSNHAPQSKYVHCPISVDDGSIAHSAFIILAANRETLILTV